ncbi:MAG: HD domain-containing protein [Roseiarcus sp.]
MNDVVAIMRAADFAARKHTHQRRKGELAEPYLNHLVEVADLAAEATDGQPEIVAAALLHDAVEDQGVTLDEIAATFGAPVASLVAEVSDDTSLPKAERKRLQIEHAAEKSPGACVIKLADKTSNLRAIASSPPRWSIERKRDYIDWASAVVARLPIRPAGLLAQFDEAVHRARQSLEQQR